MKTPQPTATIYEFPSGRRASSRSSIAPLALPAPPQIAKTECGGAWYHEAAVEDALSKRGLVRPVRLFTDRG